MYTYMTCVQVSVHADVVVQVHVSVHIIVAHVQVIQRHRDEVFRNKLLFSAKFNAFD